MLQDKTGLDSETASQTNISNYLQHSGHQTVNVDNCGQIDFLGESGADPALQEAMSLLQVEEEVLQVEGSWVGQFLEFY